MKRLFQIIYSINGWEYSGVVEVECFDLKFDENDKYTVYADGVKITFGEEIGEVEEINWFRQ